MKSLMLVVVALTLTVTTALKAHVAREPSSGAEPTLTSAADAHEGQALYYRAPLNYALLLGEWHNEGSVHGLTMWEPVGASAHVLELNYAGEDTSTFIEIDSSGEVYEGSAFYFVDYRYRGRLAFGEVAAPSANCNGSYSGVRGVVTSGDCWSFGIYDENTGCTTWRCNKDNHTSCTAHITFVGGGDPPIDPVWACGSLNDRNVTSCPGGGGGTATVNNATSGC